MHLEILLEESSMEAVIKTILTQLTDASPSHTWATHPHQGKQNLVKQLPAKLRAYSHWLPQKYPQHHIVIILDKDGEDCKDLKKRILKLTESAYYPEKTTIRIAITELEAWFFGDCNALEAAFPKLTRSNLGADARYRIPDNRHYPAEDLERELELVGYPGYSKLADSTKIGQFMNLAPGHNRSDSFQITLARLRSLLDSA
jgi:hypothetical protein